ncbi:MAG: putative patatin [Pseudomonas sp.]|nr:putative patatin [Pseudomonas sp.]
MDIQQSDPGEIEPPPSDDTFEIGLVMAGAVSAGAYTAGVLDFMIEALDAWETEKRRVKGTADEHSIPQHKVRIRVVTGACAGNMSAAILAVAARYEIPHFSTAIAGIGGYVHVGESIREIGASNPFYKAWVQDMSMERLLETSDLDAPETTLNSLLDSSALLSITRHALQFPMHSIPQAAMVKRCYLTDPMRYIFTHGNPHTDAVNASDIPLQWGVDGKEGWKVLGITAQDEDPIDLAHIELAGLRSSNIRDGNLAHRAILMIDPSPDLNNGSGDATPSALLPVIELLLGGWKNQARFSSEDLALAENEKVYSRFLISPKRDRSGDSNHLHIACGALGGFSGFFDIEYRHHDYLLGRRNAQKFLTDGFTLPMSNALFKRSFEANGAALLATWGCSSPVPHLPIVPLVKRLRAKDGVEEGISHWPAGAFNPESLREAISDRIDKVVGKALGPLNLSFVDQTAAKTGMWMIKGKILDAVIKAIDDGLVQGGLSVPAPIVQTEHIPADPPPVDQPPIVL